MLPHHEAPRSFGVEYADDVPALHGNKNNLLRVFGGLCVFAFGEISTLVPK